MANVIKVHTDRNGFPLYDLDLTAADAVYKLRPAADTTLSLAVPSGSTLALINASDHFIVSTAAEVLPVEGAAAIVTTGGQNVTQMNVESISTLYFRVRAACDIYVIFAKYIG